MKRNVLILMLLPMLIAISLSYTCGSATDETTTGAAGGSSDDDDSSTDDDDDDSSGDTGCVETMETIYTYCQIYFFGNDGQPLGYQDALEECIALSDTSVAWNCRINCAREIPTCDSLLDCLNICPLDDAESDDDDTV